MTTKVRPDTKSIRIAPKNIDESFREVFTAWMPTDEDSDVRLSVATRGVGKMSVDQWVDMLHSCARSIIEGYDVPETEQPAAVFSLLHAVLTRADPDSKIAEKVDAAVKEVAAEIPGALVPADDDEAYDEHPGELVVPREVFASPDAKQVVTAWEVPVYQCPDCDEDHGGGCYIGVAVDEIEPESFGILLARMVHRYAMETRDVNESMKIHSRIEKAFHDEINAYLPKA